MKLMDKICCFNLTLIAKTVTLAKRRFIEALFDFSNLFFTASMLFYYSEIVQCSIRIPYFDKSLILISLLTLGILTCNFFSSSTVVWKGIPPIDNDYFEPSCLQLLNMVAILDIADS
jgi:hypothetical protein